MTKRRITTRNFQNIYILAVIVVYSLISFSPVQAQELYALSDGTQLETNSPNHVEDIQQDYTAFADLSLEVDASLYTDVADAASETSSGTKTTVVANATSSTAAAMLFTANTGGDTDGDGIININDQDADNDGISNAAEGFTPPSLVTQSIPFSTGDAPSGALTGNAATIDRDCLNPFTVDYDFIVTSGVTPEIDSGAFGFTIRYSAGTGEGELVYTFVEAVDVSINFISNAPSESVTFITPFDSVIAGPGSTFTSSNPSVWHNNNDNGGVTTFQFNAVRQIRLGIMGTDFTQAHSMDVTLANGATCIDTDGDGIEDYLDLDSDGDGCPDALEGDGSFVFGDLVADTSLGDNVDANGVPMVAGNPANQGIGTSRDSTTINPDCATAVADPDGDGILNILDVDDDNDGILDTNEGFVPPSPTTQGVSFVAVGSGVPASSGEVTSISRDCLTPLTVDYSFTATSGDTPNLTGTPAGLAISYQGGLSGEGQLVYTFSEPVNVTMGFTSNAPSESVTFFSPFDAITPGVGSTFANTGTGPANWHNNNLGGASGPTTMFQYNNVTRIVLGIMGTNFAQSHSMQITFPDNAVCRDTDRDGLADFQDLDSDNDGCPDALEGDGGFTLSDLAPNTSLGATSDANGSPIVAGATITQADVSSINPAVTSANCDSDGDGVLDPADVCDGFDDTIDTDADGIPNGCDLDADNDGIPNTSEGRTDGSPTSQDIVFTTVSGPSGNVATITRDCLDPLTVDYDFVVTNGDLPDIQANGAGDAAFAFFYSGSPSGRGNLSGEGVLTYTFSEPVSVSMGFNSNAVNEVVTFFTPYDAITPGPESTILNAGAFPEMWNNNNNAGITTFQFNNVTQIVLGIMGTNLDQNHTMNITFTDGATCTDTDGDGIEDYIDLDSDNDGCPDSAEGVGASTDATNTLGCIDTDGDGVADINDLDDDNDGILDMDETSCFAGIPPAQDPNPTVLVDYGDFSINYVEGTGTLSTSTGGGAPEPFIVPDGLGTSSFEFTPNVVNTQLLLTDFDNEERLAISVFDAAGNLVQNVTPFIIQQGSNVGASSNATSSVLIEGLSVTSIPFFTGDDGNIRFLFTFPVSRIEFDFFDRATTGVIGYVIESICADIDTDGDGIPNSIDLDSDGDGCPDALEGDGGFDFSDLDADTSLGDTVDANGSPIVGGTSTGGGTTATAAPVNFTFDTANLSGATVTTQPVTVGADQFVLSATAINNPGADPAGLFDLGGGDLAFFLNSTNTALNITWQVSLTVNGSPSNFTLNGFDYASFGGGTFDLTNNSGALITDDQVVTGSGGVTGSFPVTNTANATDIPSFNIVGLTARSLTFVDFHNISVTPIVAATGGGSTGSGVAQGIGSSNDATTSSAACESSLSVIKNETSTSGFAVGDVINYDIIVTNDGATPVTNIQVTDPNAVISGTNPIPSLDPGDSVTLTAVHTLTAADLAAGFVENTATVTGDSPLGGAGSVTDSSDAGTDPDGNPITDPEGTETPDGAGATDGDPTNDPTVTAVMGTPELTLTKTGVLSGTGLAGDTITYTFTVENTGNVPVANVQVFDALLGSAPIPVTPSTLNPGDIGTATGVYTITQADVDAGGVTNSASANGIDPTGNPVSDVSDNGDEAIDGPDADTDPTNDATVTAITANPEFTFTKTASVGGTGAVGDVITYTFSVENTGNVTLDNITVTDPLLGGTPIPITPDPLAPGATGTGTATYTITQADVDAGGVTNSATVNGEDPDGNVINDVSDDGDETVDGPDADTDPTNDGTISTTETAAPELTFTKTASVGGTGAVGDVITYTFTVENTGNVTIDNITVVDPLLGATPIPVTPSSLAPGAIGTATATYTITQADVDAGGVSNSATAGGTDPDGNPVTDVSDNGDEAVDDDGDGDPTNDSTETAVAGAPEITLTKTASVGGTGAVGDVITYTFTVENTGSVTINNLMVTDPLLGASIPVTPSTLAPGAIGTATGTYTITQADVDAGGVTNSATANGSDPAGGRISDVSDNGDETVDDDGDGDPTNDSTDTATQTAAPELTFTKTASVGGTGAVGDVITYTFTVENTGNVTIDNITVVDPLLGTTPIPVTPSSLAPGAIGTATATYTITQADVDAGGVSNSATAGGTDPDGNPVTDVSDNGDEAVDDDGDGDPTNDSTDTATETAAPELTFTKTASVGGTGAAGDVITYTFTVENTGNVTIDNVTVVDPLLGVTPIPVTPSSLAPGAIGTATATYTITQADVDAGGVSNSATAGGTDPDGNPVTDVSDNGDEAVDDDGDGDPTNDSTDTATETANPELTLTKTGGISGSAVGDIVTYTFTVENTGNVTIDNITIVDPLLGTAPIAVTPSTLAPGDTGTATATYTIVQADVDAGGVTNSATAGGTDPDGNAVTDMSDDGNEAVDNDGDGDPTNDPTFTSLTPMPELTFTKTATVSGTGVAGDVITYTFTVENTGNVTIDNITVTDPLLGGAPIAIAPNSLAPGATGTATGTYIITQADVDAGGVSNSATVGGTDPAGNPVTDMSDNGDEAVDADGDGDPTNDSTQTATATADPELTFTKTASVGGTGALGDVITYTFTVENTGNVTVDNITVVDPLLGGTPIPVTPSSLAPGAIGTATGTYTITQADVDAGSVSNSATANGQDPDGNAVSDVSDNGDEAADGPDADTDPTNDSTITSLAGAPELTFTKTAVVTGGGEVGDVIIYTFSVENTGTTTVNNVTVSDPLFGTTPIAIAPSSLAPGDVGTATATYTITQADIDAGGVTNSATANGTDATGTPVSDVSDDGNETVDGPDADIDPTNDGTFTSLSGTPELTFTKTASVTGTGVAGDVITYTFTVVNTGTVTIDNITVTDPLLGATPIGITPSSLAPGATGTATATYIITQADVDAGGVTNSATVTGMDPDGNPVTDVSDDGDETTDGPDADTDPTNDGTVTTTSGTSELTLTKTGSVSGTGTVGDVITYTFTVENTGTLTVNNVTITDPLLGGTAIPVTPSTLAPGAIGTATANYTITQADVNAGSVTNTATGNGVDAAGNGVSDVSDDGDETADGPDADTDPTNDATITMLTPMPELTLTKTASVGGAGAAGDVITYTFTVVNTGNVTIDNVTVSDPLLGTSPLAVTPISLVPGATGTATGTYVITQADVNAGGVTNSAIANGQDAVGNTISDVSDNGDETVDGPDADTDPTNDATVTAITANPELTLTKIGALSGTGTVGDVITYTFMVENTGNVTIDNVTITDPLLGTAPIAVTPISLAPGDVGTATATYTITQADVNAGSVTNSATVNGQDPDGNAVSDVSDDGNEAVDGPDADTDPTNDGTVTSLTPTPELTFTKTAVVGGTGTVGDVITYTFSVENTGNVTIDNVTVVDPLLGATPIPVTPSTLAPGATGTATATYTITQADVDAGSVTNSATAVGVDPTGSAVSDVSDDGDEATDGPDADTDPTNDSTVTTLSGNPELTFTKTAVVGGTGNVGDVITYTFTVENTGDVTISNITVTDPLLGTTPIAITPSTLAPGATGTATAIYVITQADVDAGGVSNSATVNGNDPNGNPISDASDNGDETADDDGDGNPGNDSTDTATVTPAPELTFTKTATVSGTGDVGDVITYTFNVLNTGNVTISNVTVTDPLLGGAPIPVTPNPLAPGATGTATATYIITQADVDAGGVTNSATANGQDAAGNTVSDVSDNGDETADDDGDGDPTNDATITPVAGSPELTFTKTAVVGGTGAVGDVITYTFSVENTGTVTISNITVTDPLLGGTPIPITPDPLAPGAIGTATATYTITQADVDAGGVSNSATVNGNDPAGNAVSDVSDNGDETADDDGDGDPTNDSTNTGTATAAPQLTFTKTATVSGTGAVGDVITYTFSVQNTGNVTVSNITVTDPLLGGAPIPITPDPLAPGATGTATATYVITQADVDAGGVTNSATANGQDPAGNPVSDVSDDGDETTDGPDADTDPTNDGTITTIANNPEMTLTKTATVGGTGAVGDIITYTFTVENTGDVTLTNVSVDDPLLGPTPILVTPSTLAPGEIGTATGTYVITQADVDAGGVTNTAIANGQDIVGNAVQDVSDNGDETTDTDGDSDPTNDATVTALGSADPELTLTKTASVNGSGALGDVITYTFIVENTGDVVVNNVTIDDPLTGTTALAVTPGTLAPGETGTATATYIITQADISRGFVQNTATANGTDNAGNTVSDVSDSGNETQETPDGNGATDGDPTNDPTIVALNPITVFDGITPNGDGVNDELIIEGLENFPNNNVKIFNRLQVEVYDRDAYHLGPFFSGRSDGRITIQEDEELPSGVYFYVITYEASNGQIVRQAGPLYIRR